MHQTNVNIASDILFICRIIIFCTSWRNMQHPFEVAYSVCDVTLCHLLSAKFIVFMKILRSPDFVVLKPVCEKAGLRHVSVNK